MFWIQKSEHILILKSARNYFEQRLFKNNAVNLKDIKIVIIIFNISDVLDFLRLTKAKARVKFSQMAIFFFKR